MKYTYSDEEEEEDAGMSSDLQDRRRSARGMAQSAGESMTASGRRTRPPHRDMVSGVGASMDSADNYERSDVSEEMSGVNGRATRSGRRSGNGWAPGNQMDSMDSDEQLADDYNSASSGDEWEGEDEIDDHVDDEEEEEMTEASDEDAVRPSLVVKLRYSAGASSVPNPGSAGGILSHLVPRGLATQATDARPSESPETTAAFITPSTNGTTPTKAEPNGPDAGFHQENKITFAKYSYRPPTPEAQQVLSDRSKTDNFASPAATVVPKSQPETLESRNQNSAFHHQNNPQRAAFPAG
jgi:hypothetical protein